MNLVKNGTVLLAALSVLAMTSCGSNTQKLTYEKALEWVKQHYAEQQPARTITHSNVVWDYTKNVETEATPEEFGEPFKGQKLNWYFQYSLQDEFGVADAEKVKSPSGNYKIDGTGTLDEDDVKQSLTAETFAHKFSEDDTFEVNGGNLIVKETDDFTGEKDGRTVYSGYGVKLKIHFVEVDTYYFNDKGYLNKFDVQMSSNDTLIRLVQEEKNNGEGETEIARFKAGKLDGIVTTTPLEE